MLLVAVSNALWLVAREDGRWGAERIFTRESRLQSVAIDPGPGGWEGRDPGWGGRIYCGTAAEGLWHSVDLGRSWARVGEGALRERVTAVAVSTLEREAGANEAAEAGAAARAAVVYAGTEPSALFRSGDGGGSWEECQALRALPSASTWSFPPRPETSHVRWIAPDPLVAGRLFVAIEAGALVSSHDGGSTWIDRRPGGPYDTHKLVVHPRVADRLYSAAGDGYFESHTGGASWERREEGLEHRYVWGLTVDPVDSEIVVISAARSAGAAHNAERAESWIYRRAGGTAWQAVTKGLPDPSGTTISALAVDPAEPGVVYAANNRGIYRSEDRGESWEQLEITWPAEYERERVAALVPTGAGSGD